MIVAVWVVVLLIAIFAFVLLVGAPYLPTLKSQVAEALDLLDLKPGQTLLELGSGDGKLLVAAAKKGINSVGYEINPLLFVFSWVRTRKHRSLISLHYGNYWRAQWPPAEGIYVFLLQKYMPKLDKKITQNYKGHNVKLVSLAFKIPGKEPAKKTGALYLYVYNSK